MILKIVTAAWLGLSAGAMLAGGALLVPYWRSLAAADFFTWYAANGQRMLVWFSALQVPAALLAIAAALVSARAAASDRRLCVVAAVCATAVFVPYFAFFQQANAGFAAAATADLPAELARYAAWQWLRIGLGLAAFIASLVALRRTA
jgi:hypothetical protein